MGKKLPCQSKYQTKLKKLGKRERCEKMYEKNNNTKVLNRSTKLYYETKVLEPQRVINVIELITNYPLIVSCRQSS